MTVGEWRPTTLVKRDLDNKLAIIGQLKPGCTNLPGIKTGLLIPYKPLCSKAKVMLTTQ